METQSPDVQGDWIDPERAKVTVKDYLDRWIVQRPGLRPRTRELYKWLLRKHIEGDLGGVELGKLSTSAVREWRSNRIDAGVSETVTAKAYRLLRAAMNTAVEEDKIPSRNPCKVRGADREHSAERPVLTMAQVFDLADAMPGRYRALVLLAAFDSLRWGNRTRPVGYWTRCADGARIEGARRSAQARACCGSPKSRAGNRVLAIPAAIRPDIVAHLDTYVGTGTNAYVFTGDKGNPLRRPNFNQRVSWTKVVADMGLTGLHFHDLRHAGNTGASKAKMSTKDLMARMGHDDMRAALIYQHATSDADERVAYELSRLADEHRRGRKS